MKRTCLFLSILLFAVSIGQQVKAQLVAYEPNLYGKYEITAGAKGSNNRPDYLYINKPAGATTVYKIYMYNAGTGTGNANPSNVVTVDGVAYTLPNLKTANQVANGTVGAATYKGYSGSVAGAMKTKLDNATAGTVITFSVDEGPQTYDTDGVGIIVIWNNPTKNAGSHFVYIGMDMIVGGAGTTINIPVSPIDKTIPGYEPILGIGINYSTGICDAYYGGGCQLATIKVNGNKITDNAGGYDDGSNNNGALITLGGYGDDPNNNDADELYNIKDQLTNGATNLQFNFKDFSGDVDDVVNAIYFSGVGVTPPACVFAPPVTATPISNICPANTVNLDTQGYTDIIPSGASLFWFTNNTHTGGRLTGTQVTEAGAGTYYAFYFNSSGSCYSPASNAVTVTINACAMSVDFGGINADIANGKLSVNWTSLTETTNDSFEIEASTDGTNFTKIGTVVSKAKDGNSGAVLDYEFTTQADALALKLGISLMLIGGIGIGFAFKRRSHKLLAMGIAMALTVIAVSCNKGNDVSATKDGKLFIRITQVDKDGTKRYSKTIQAVKK